MRTQRVAVSVIIAGLLSAISAFSEIHPLSTPCRILDTRNTSVGYLPGGQRLNFQIRSDGFGQPALSQGGQSSCQIPDTAEGVVFNLTAISPSATGHAVVWPFDVPQPLAAAMVFAVVENTSNLVSVRLAPFGSSQEVSLAASASAYWVVDVESWIGSSVTDSMRGIVTNKQGSVPEEILLELDNSAVWLVCREPWIEPAACDQHLVGGEVCATGHYALYPSLDAGFDALYVDGINDCL